MANPFSLFGRRPRRRLLNVLGETVDATNATPRELKMFEALMVLEGSKEHQFVERRAGLPVHKFKDYDSYLLAGSKHVWASNRACKLIAAAVMTASFKIVGTRGRSEEIVLTGNEPETIALSLGGFLKRPNPYDSFEQLIELTVFHLELCGNAYWHKDDMDMRGRPSALYPLLPQHVRIVPGLNEKVMRYEYHVNGTMQIFEPEEIIHFQSSNPRDLSLGMGSIEPAEPLFNSVINHYNVDEAFVKNGAQLSGVMTRDPSDDSYSFTPEEWELFKKKFHLEYGGKANVGKLAMLNGRWQFHKLGLTMAEAQTMEREKWGVEQIFLNHGVPLSVAGLNSANYAAARVEEINFRKYKVLSILDLLVGKLNADGFIQANGQLELVYEMGGLVDVEQIVKEFLPLLKAGVISRNEMREMVGLPTISDNPTMDEFMVDGQVMPLDMAGLGDPSLEQLDAVVGSGRTDPGKRKPKPQDLELDLDLEDTEIVKSITPAKRKVAKKRPKRIG